MAKKNGRPSKYTDSLAMEICKEIAAGMTLTRLCSRDDMPHRDTVYAWLEDKPGFSDMYMRARVHQALGWADEVMDIADAREQDVYVDDDGNERTDHHIIQRDKLRVDTRFTMLEKIMPRVFGRHQPLPHTIEDGDITVEIRQLSSEPIDKPKNLKTYSVEEIEQMQKERRNAKPARNGHAQGNGKVGAD